MSREYDPSDEGGLLWRDPDLKIRWPIESPSLSQRDAAYPLFKQLTADRLPHDPSSP